MRLQLSTNQEVYAPGERITATLALRNEGPEPAFLRFATGQRYDLVVETTAGERLRRWSDDMGFIQMLGEERLEPGGALTYQQDIEGPAEPGTYAVVGLITSFSHPLRATVTVAVR